jgi:uncharacterized protein DUF3551
LIGLNSRRLEFRRLRGVDRQSKFAKEHPGETAMRYSLIAVLLLVGGVAYAQDYTSSGYCAPWCTQGSPEDGGMDCSYYTFNQCLAAAWGTGNHCYTNPFLYQCRRPAAGDHLRARRR